MNNEKRMVGAYEVKHAIHIGDKEVLFCQDDTNAETPYMVCFCSWDNPLNMDQFFDVAGSDDYIEIMTEFVSRVQTQVSQVTKERESVTVSTACFTVEQCVPLDSDTTLENKVAVIRQSSLRPEYHTADKQLVLVTGGFGASPKSRGRAVFTINLYSGKEARWNREDILGILKPDELPDWAKENLIHIQARLKSEKKRNLPER